jgi:hypothetical protein
VGKHPLLSEIPKKKHAEIEGNLSGEALWKKFQKLRREIVNEIAELTKEPPTRTTLEDLLLIIRTRLYAAGVKGTAREGTVLKETWYPPAGNAASLFI